jgi:hypothetical protein
VFLVNEWNFAKEHRERYYFNGEIAPRKIRETYLHKSVDKYWKQGSQNPIKYVNC